MSALSEATVDKLQRVWASVTEVCAGLGEADWERATDCPGWTVKDQLSHLVGTEAALAGRPAPPHTAPEAAWVRNPLGRHNEDLVDARRPSPGGQVLAEWREVTAQRLAQLRAMTDDDFAGESWTPVGPGTVLDFLQIRILDAWVHEQDIRRAVGRPGHLDGPVAEHAVDRLLRAVPMIVGKRAAAPEGADVIVEVTGPVARTVAVRVEGGRARPLDTVPKRPAARITLDTETFTVLSCGRREPARVLAGNAVALSGDRALGRAVVENLNVMI